MQQEKLLFGPIIRKDIRTTAGLEYCCMGGLLRVREKNAAEKIEGGRKIRITGRGLFLTVDHSN